MKTGAGTPDSSTPGPSARGGAAGGRQETSIPAVLMATLQRAAEVAKRALGAQGRVAPMAVFAYKSRQGHGDGDGADEFKSVSLVWRTELQKETLKRRITEKASAERASAVVVVAGADAGGARAARAPFQEKGVLLFSGAAPDARASARATYILERETKTLSSWEMRVSSEPGETFFLEGVFGPSKMHAQESG